MEFVAIFLVLASVVVAQDLGNLPSCANCLAEYTTGDKIGDCGRLDAKCICASDTFISGIACCLEGVCNTYEQQQAVDFARTFCSTQGVTDLPQSVTCATASPSLSSSAASTTPTVTDTSEETATPNAASPAALGANTGLYGGILAALAML